MSKERFSWETRLALALGLPADVAEEDGALLLDWLRGQPAGADDRVHVTAAVDAGLRRMCWLVDGPPAIFRAAADSFLDDVGASAQEQRWLAQMTAALQPEQLGTWLALTPHGVDGGWHLVGNASPAPALALLQEVADVAVFGRWQATVPADRCHLLRRSVGEPTPMLELTIDLSPLGDAPALPLRRLFDDLQTAWLGDDFFPLLRDEGATTVDLVLGVTAAGVSRLGVAIPRPSRSLSLLLGALADQRIAETLARAEGTLGVDAPALLIFSRMGNGWDAEYQYVL